MSECLAAFDWESGSESATVAPNGNFILKYKIFDVATFDEAVTLLGATAPTLYRGYTRQLLTCEPITIQDWNGEVTYHNGPSSDPDLPEFNWDTGGGTYKRLFARQHIADYCETGISNQGYLPKNHYGAIGVTNKNTVEGVELPVPVYNWSESYTKAQSFVDTSYKLKVFNLTGRMNNAPFKGFAKGECLFMGAQAVQRGENPLRVTYKFQSLPNETNIIVSPQITVPFKYGWDYLWVEFDENADEAQGAMSLRPTDVHIERVFLFGDFSLLGIGI